MVVVHCSRRIYVLVAKKHKTKIKLKIYKISDHLLNFTLVKTYNNSLKITK